MVSKASELFPDPLRPVITVRLLRGISTSMFFRLCWRAPCTVIRSSIEGRSYHCRRTPDKVARNPGWSDDLSRYIATALKLHPEHHNPVPPARPNVREGTAGSVKRPKR